MSLETKLTALRDFIPITSTLTFLTCVRKVCPYLYTLLEQRYAHKFVPCGQQFSTVNPKKFLEYSTRDFEFF